MPLRRNLLSIGECMVEFAHAENGLMRKSFAGDTFNTAWYARALLPSGWTVEYLTAVGRDAMSNEMLAFMEREGIGTSFVRRIEGRSPGLYVIDLVDGERNFTYWRGEAAARELARDRMNLANAIELADVIYFSGVTLAVLPSDDVTALLCETLKAKHSGKTVVFDPNIRPALWKDIDAMRKRIYEAVSSSTWTMPSFDDEERHFGDRSATDTIRRYRAAGCENIVLKDGAKGTVLSVDGVRTPIPATSAEAVIDTTGAGDSFNGAFLAHLLVDGDAVHAGHFAARVAAHVVARHGALAKLTPALTLQTAPASFNVK